MSVLFSTVHSGREHTVISYTLFPINMFTSLYCSSVTRLHFKVEAASRLKVLLYKPPTLVGCAPESNHDFIGNKIAHCSERHTCLGKGSKTPIAALCRYGGGVPPLAVFFFGYFFGRSGAVMGGGYPPLP